MATAANHLAASAEAEERRPLGRRLLDYLVYLVLRTAMMVIQVFPFPVMRQLARLLGNLMFRLSGKHRRRAIDHLTQSFKDEMTPQQIEATARACMQHMFLLGMEIICLAKLINRNNWYEYVELKNAEKALQVILDNRGIILLTGHFGNWELIGYAIGALGVRTYAVARPLDNPYIERWMLRTRQETGQTIISKFGASDTAVKVVQSNHPLCFVGDQHAGTKGVWVDFFGRKASNYKSIALLSLSQNCPIAVGGAWRLGDEFKFRGEIVDIIDPQDYQNDPQAVFNITQRYNLALETVIRKAPAQYLWMHRRWRDPPPPRKKKSALATADSPAGEPAAKPAAGAAGEAAPTDAPSSDSSA